MRRIVLVSAAIAAALGLAACGSSSSTNHSAHSMPMSSMPAAATGDHNSADLMFAQMMVPHHQSAIEMAKLAPSRAESPEVKALAADIEAAQGPEITEMTGWLASWKQPAADMHMSDSMPGAMSASEMNQLMAASGSAFDRQFLTMMISHHQAAIDMAKTEQSSGQYGPARTLADNIVKSQADQITEMQGLLKTV